jgi:hypothetical protein
MLNKASFRSSSSNSSLIFRIPPTVPTHSRFSFSQFVMTITVVVLLVAFLPCVSSSPTSSSESIQHNNNNNKIIHDPNPFMSDSNEYQMGSQGDSSASAHEQPLSASSSFWYAQPRSHANQFLMSHVNDNEVMVPKWFTRFNNNNGDMDIDDYIPSDMQVNKRSSYNNNGGYQVLKKRKQLTKPPMEVMNEIVNSIYLKR